MAVQVIIKQKGFIKKSLSLNDIKKIGGDKYEYGSRDNNSSYIFEEFNSRNVINPSSSIVLKNRSKLGRGFIVFVDNKSLGLTLNVPTTNNDIADFYEFIENACKVLNTTEFVQDNAVLQISEIKQTQSQIEDWNGDYLKSFLEDHHQIIIYGVENPLYMPERTRLYLTTLSGKELDRAFSDYLDLKQSSDLYYMKPTFYSKDGDVKAVYVLTEGIDCIVPKEAFVPYVSINNLNGAVPKEWILAIVFLDKNKNLIYTNFDKFMNYISSMKLEEYDDKHWILRGIEQEFIEGLLNNK